MINRIKAELESVNNVIFQKLDLDETEYALIDYALEINRTLIVGNEREKEKLFSAIAFKNTILDSYASMFIERFKSKLDNRDKKFVVEIWHTKQIIGIFFKMVP